MTQHEFDRLCETAKKLSKSKLYNRAKAQGIVDFPNGSYEYCVIFQSGQMLDDESWSRQVREGHA